MVPVRPLAMTPWISFAPVLLPPRVRRRAVATEPVRPVVLKLAAVKTKAPVPLLLIVAPPVSPVAGVPLLLPMVIVRLVVVPVPV